VALAVKGGNASMVRHAAERSGRCRRAPG